MHAAQKIMLGIIGTIMKLIKYLGALVVAALLLFVFVVNFSSVESHFQCSGKISSEAGSYPTTIYMKLAEYRWWVGLWGDSDGALWIEIPNKVVEYYGHVVEVGDQLQIFNSPKELKGNFSTLSKTLAISTPVGFFDGTCTKNER